MAIVNGIVKTHEGTIAVRKRAWVKGTTFSIYIPKIEVQPEEAVQERDPLPRGSERILLVDDEAAVIKMGTSCWSVLVMKVTSETSSVNALCGFRLETV